MNKMHIETDITRINTDGWNDFIHRHPKASFFQSSKAYFFFNGLSNHSPFVICISDNSRIYGILTGVQISEPGLKSMFSKRTIIWGGPLAIEDNSQIIKELLDNLNKITSGSIYFEIRNIFNTSANREVIENLGFRYKSHLNFKVEIKSREENLKLISKSKIRQIRSSLKNGASIKIADTIEEIRAFYLILHNLYKTKVKKPLPSFEFFESFFLNQYGKVFVILYQSEVVGGILCPIYEDKAIYEWYIAGMDAKYKKIFPSVLATWAPIEYAVENNIACFDFLGAGSPDSDYGVREFKSKFGGELVDYGRYHLVTKPMLYRIGKLGMKMIKFAGRS